MKTKITVSCVIPYWNEEERLKNVLNEVIEVKNLAEIVCVDDASTDNSVNVIKKHYPIIKFVRLNKNVGKSSAILKGLKFVTGEYVLLLDADLRNLNHTELEKAVDVIQHNPGIDMLILRRIKAPFFVKLTRGDILSTGERIIKKDILLTVLNYTKGWELESKINLFMFKNNKNVVWFPHSGINTHFKWGFKTDIKYHKKKMKDIFSVGFINQLKLLLFFGYKQFNMTTPRL